MARLTNDEMRSVYDEVRKIKQAVLMLDNILAEHTDYEANEFIEKAYPFAEDLDTAAWSCMAWERAVACACEERGCKVR